MWIPEVPGTLIGDRLDGIGLIGTRCDRCGQVFFPARRNCPQCLSDESIQSVRLRDEGTLESFVAAAVAPPGYDIPHIQGYIELDGDGPRIFSILTDVGDGSALKAGHRMVLKVVQIGTDSQDRPLLGYRFRPMD
jgi:hypothetical protein